MRVTFPFNLKFNAHFPRLQGVSSPAVQGIDGAFSAQPRMGGHWRMSASFHITNEAQALALQAFTASMEGAVGTCLVPVPTKYPARGKNGQPAPMYLTAALGNDSIQFGQGSQTAQHFGFTASPVVYAQLQIAAPLRAVQLRVAATACLPLRPGQQFSIGDHLHMVQLAWDDEGGQVVQITPPLRAAAAAGDMLVLDVPHCLMRFATADEGWQAFTIDPMQSITLNFAEAI